MGLNAFQGFAGIDATMSAAPEAFSGYSRVSLASQCAEKIHTPTCTPPA